MTPVSGPAAVPALALVPAAGASRRMGEPKLLLPFGDSTVIESTLAALRGGGAGRLCVVTRPEDHTLRRRLEENPRFLLAPNPAPERGMLSSILVGLDALGGAAGLADEGAILLVCPADLPALATETVAAVLAAARAGAGALAVPVHTGRSGKRGHPLAITPRLVPELPGLDPDVGLRQLLARHPDATVEVPVDDPGCVRDVDTPEEYRRLRGG